MKTLRWTGSFLYGPFLDFCAHFVVPVLNVISLFIGTFLFFDANKDAPYILTLFDFFTFSQKFTIFMIAMLASTLISVALAWREPRMSGLKAELASAQGQIGEFSSNIPNLFDGLLLNLSKRLKFSQSGQSRVSLYVHDGANSRFIPCGRYSPNPELRKPGRVSYADDEGCIAKGWQQSWYFFNQFPDAAIKHQKHNESEYRIPKDVYLKLSMKSRLYAVKRIDSARGAPIAVIVVESLKHDEFNAEELKLALHESSDDFGQMIETLRNHIPSPMEPAERGL